MRTLTLVVVAALAAAAPAAAKELTSVAVCGAADCVTYTSRGEMAALVEVDPAAAAPAAPGPYYVVSVKGSEGSHAFGWKTFYVPSAHRQVAFDEGAGTMRWSEASPAARALLDAAARRIEPFPAPTLASVRVDGRVVSGDPQTYLQLFDAGSRVEADPPTWDWVGIDLVAPATTPWTGSDRDLAFSPGGRLVERGGVRVRVADAVASDIAAGRTVTLRDGGFPWGLALTAAVAATLVALLAGWRLRRRGAGAPARRVAAPPD